MTNFPLERRALITTNFNSLDIVIPTKRSWYTIIFMLFWLTGWAVGEGFAINDAFNSGTPLSSNLFVLVWLAGWTFGGAFALYTLFWQLVGKEKISIERGMMTVERLIWTIGKKQEYNIQSIKNMEVNQLPKNTFLGKQFERSEFAQIGKIKFDYNGETIAIASDIDQEEAKVIINRLKTYPAFSELNFREKYK